MTGSQRKQRQKPRDFNEIDSLIFGEAIQVTEAGVDEERPLQQASRAARETTDDPNRPSADEGLVQSFIS